MSSALLSAIERSRRRLWSLCYRMTGNRSDADDLTQEAMARAIERAAQSTAEDPTGWLLKLTTRVCLDHLRTTKVRRRLTELVDPLTEAGWVVDAVRPSPENALVLQEDVRFAIVVALQQLSPKQRAALVLRDVCGQSLAEIADALDSNENAIKALLQRARAALVDARGTSNVDTLANPAVVERFAQAVHAGSIEQITALLADDVWGMVDGGGLVVTSNKPTYGKQTVARQWANARMKLGVPVQAEVCTVNGEPAVMVRLAGASEVMVALVHLETRDGLVAAQRVLRDPRRLERRSG